MLSTSKKTILGWQNCISFVPWSPIGTKFIIVTIATKQTNIFKIKLYLLANELVCDVVTKFQIKKIISNTSKYNTNLRKKNDVILANFCNIKNKQENIRFSNQCPSSQYWHHANMSTTNLVDSRPQMQQKTASKKRSPFGDHGMKWVNWNIFVRYCSKRD